MSVDDGAIALRSQAEYAYAVAKRAGDVKEMERQAQLARQYNELLRYPKRRKK